MLRISSELSVRRQCELLRITRSTVYYEPKEQREADVQCKEELMARIDYWHTLLPCMGTRKIAVIPNSEQKLLYREKYYAELAEESQTAQGLELQKLGITNHARKRQAPAGNIQQGQNSV